ncbi:MAG: diguanylate cyclase [Candidatus Scalindua sp.]|nr:diguanylate cyclase [Candidatus Scalindua sp.]
MEGKELSISVSIGISIYPEDSFDIDILINKADVAMYNAKEHGGNNYKFFISE